MASISREKNGRRTIQFVAADGKRKSIRLGKVSQRVAEAIKVRIEKLSSARLAGHAPDDETTRWVADLDEEMYKRLAAVGLVSQREHATLKSFLDRFLANRNDLKSGTLTAYGHTRRNLVDYFGAERPLAAISPGEADEWRRYLATEGLCESTVRRRCGVAKQFFHVDFRKRLLQENPFADLKSGGQVNRERLYFVTRQEARQVIDGCPDAQWRLLFALSRFGRLRCPSENLALRLGHVD